jgi:conjugative transfer signal peptidase TraF
MKLKGSPRRALRVLIVCVLALAIPLGAAWFAGVRINNSPSLPLGLWQRVGGTPAHGDYVLVRVDDNPAFSDGIRAGVFSKGTPLMKRLAALPGDTVEVTAGGVSVNGVPWPNSAVITTFKPPAAGGVVPAGMCWILSDYHWASFDSRYFGPIPLANIEGRMRPIFTWDAQNHSEASGRLLSAR